MPAKKASRRSAGARAPAGAGETRYRSIFQHSAVSLWEEDIGGLRSAIARLAAGGVTDIRGHLREHPEFVAEAASGITVVDVNDATLELYGASCKEELLGSLDRTLDMADPVMLASVSDLIAAVYSGQTRLQARSTAVTLGGRKLDIVLRFYIPTTEDPYPYMLVSVLDVTDQRKAEEELHRSRQLLQLVLDHVPQRVFWKDRELRYLGCNRNFASDAGLRSPDEIVGRDDLELAWRESADLYRQDDRRVMESGLPKLDYEEPQVRTDGSMLWLRTSKVPLRDRSGNVFGVLGTYEDVTERKRGEEALRESEQHYRELFTAAQRQAKELALLDQVRTALAGELELPVVFRTVVQAISRVFGYSHVSLFLLQGDRLMLQHQVGYRDVIREIPLTQGISGRVARTGRPVLLKNVRSDPDFIKVTEGIVSELCIPLFDQGKIAGTLNVETTEATPLGEADLEALSALGQHVGIAIAKARLYAAARESEERYRSLVEALGEGIGIVDPNETFTFANPAAEVVFGVPPGGLAGRSLRDFLSEEEFRRTLSETRRRRQGEKTTYELEIRRSDGEARRIELTATPRVDAAGAFVGTLGIFHDVTEYRRLQKSLEQERGLLLTLINSLPDYIYLKDRESRFILVNQAQAELVGVADARALVGRTDRDFVPEELAERYRLDDLRVMESGRSLINIEEPSRSSAGYLRWVLTTKVPIIDSSGAVTGLVGISRDITERKEAVEKLGNFIEQSPEAIVLTDEEGIVIEYNLSAEKLMGIPRTEALGMSAWALTKAVTIRRPASPRYVPALQDRFRSALREGAASFLNRQMAGSLRRPDGAIRQFEQYNFCIRTSKGFQLGSISRDVTEARQTEAALRASEEQLAQAQKLEAVGRLAGGIAHDFNNLLTVIKGYAELINSKLDQGSPALGDVMEIKRTAQRAADLTSQLLAFSRKQVLQPTVIKATDVVRGMQEMLLRIIGEDISLSAVLPPDTGNVRADRGRMEQVIMNLAANARDAMPQGGRLTIETGNVTLSEAEARERPELAPGDYVLLTVQDTGVGIDRETLPRIFEPFFTTKAAGKGTGLGLATVYGVVTQSGGAIACESEPGAGTTFRIWLPRVLEEVAGGERPEKVTGAPGGSETILLVEDEETMRRFARSVLEASGYVVIEAASGEEALAALSRGGGAASLLLSDVVMPGMSGPQLGRAVARIRPGVRILYMSGYAEESLAGHGMLEPGIDLLQKPFDASTLLARVRAAIDRT